MCLEQDGHDSGTRKSGAPIWVIAFLVPEAGLEPAQGCPYRILSPARLPFHHSGTQANIDNGQSLGIQEQTQRSKFKGLTLLSKHLKVELPALRSADRDWTISKARS